MGPSFAGCSSSSGPSVHAARGRRALVVVAAQKSRSRKNVCINKTLTARAEATPKVRWRAQVAAASRTFACTAARQWVHCTCRGPSPQGDG